MQSLKLNVEKRIGVEVSESDGQVEVHIEGDRVILRGVARDYLTRRAAGAAARQVDGVVEVENLVRIDPIRMAGLAS